MHTRPRLPEASSPRGWEPRSLSHRLVQPQAEPRLSQGWPTVCSSHRQKLLELWVVLSPQPRERCGVGVRSLHCLLPGNSVLGDLGAGGRRRGQHPRPSPASSCPSQSCGIKVWGIRSWMCFEPRLISQPGWVLDLSFLRRCVL